MLDKKVEELRDEFFSSLVEILKIKSVEGKSLPGMPFGEGPNEALEKALEICDDLGFNTVNLDGYVGYAEYGTGEDYVAVLGHLDVVPEGDGWMYPPYGAEIHDGKLYARGVMDDKGPIFAALYGLKAIKELQLPLSKRVRIIFGTNEESGSHDMPYYVEREKAPVAGFTPDGMFPIINGEKGLTMFKLVKNFSKGEEGVNNIEYIAGGRKANMVPDYCEAKVTGENLSEVQFALEEYAERTGLKLEGILEKDALIVKSFGKSAHGSTPEKGINAVSGIMAFLGQLDLPKGDIRKFIEFYNKYINFEVHGESMNCDLYDDISGHLSFNVGAVDINKEKGSILLNLRYPVTKTFEEMITPIEEIIEKYGISIEDMDHEKPLYFSPDSALIKTLQKVYTEYTGEEATLLSIGGGTYAKTMDNIVAFGPIFPGKPDLDHQPNECMEIEDLMMCSKIYAKAIYELAK
ncbi:dipeptidase PepV [uncultured Clostridium sp.]|uniref:dipeptidase PepV n=1 Tax=uncultured Clostridium sp. TaxID=59620 RepID=UPI0025FEDA99|nr:dipeptidase PepV [uncultured Clostridium sp.]